MLSIKKISVSIITGLIVVLSLYLVAMAAWAEPASAPPGGNIPLPLNTGNLGQSKIGGLILNTGGSTNGLIIDQGNVGIGTTTPASDSAWALPGLDISGTRGTAILRTTSASGIATLRMTGPGASSVDDWHINMAAGANSYINFSPKAGGGATGLVLKNDGYVGIGTTNPSNKLDVRSVSGSGISLSISDTQTIAKMYATGGDGRISLYTGEATPVERIHIDSFGNSWFNQSGGNVGIGMTGPGQKLTVSNNILLGSAVSGPGTPAYLDTGLNYSDGATRDKLKIYLYNSGTEQYGFGVGSGGDVQYHSNGYHDFYIANSLKMRINSSGNVGIGTTDPPYKLTVDSNNVFLRGRRADATRYRSDFLVASGGLTINAYDDTGAVYLPIQIDGSRTVLGMQGNVGIGTTAPGQKLTVWGGDISLGSAYGGGRMYLGEDNGSWLRMYTDGTRDLRIYAGGQVYLDDTTTVTGNMNFPGSGIWNTSGNVGIGATNPGAKLDVNGIVRIPTANATDNGSPGLVVVAGDDFLYDSEYLNHYGLGWHAFQDNSSPLLGTNAYLSGYFGIDLFTAGTERIRVNYNGNVGIGTTSPTQKLTVRATTNENLNVGGHLSAASGVILNAANDAYDANVPFELRGNPVFFTGGNVGIGTTDPSLGKLQVVGRIRADLGATGESAVFTGAGSNLQIKHNGTGTPVEFYNSAGTGFYLNGGNVGIGITNPGAKLEVQGNIKVSGDIKDETNTQNYIDFYAGAVNTVVSTPIDTSSVHKVYATTINIGTYRTYYTAVMTGWTFGDFFEEGQRSVKVYINSYDPVSGNAVVYGEWGQQQPSIDYGAVEFIIIARS